MSENDYKPNYEKQEIYARNKKRLKRAMASKFYYEAVFIEYAILEDRTESILRLAGVSTVKNNGDPIGLAAKLNKIRDNKAYQVPYIKKRLTNDLIEEVRDWKKIRDQLIHDLMNSNVKETELEAIATNGKKLTDVFGNKVKSVKNYFIKTGGSK